MKFINSPMLIVIGNKKKLNKRGKINKRIKYLTIWKNINQKQKYLIFRKKSHLYTKKLFNQGDSIIHFNKIKISPKPQGVSTPRHRKHKHKHKIAPIRIQGQLSHKK